MRPWYEELFDNYAEGYDKESFKHGTSGETDFIEQEIGFRKHTRILDIGCGTGRHAIELAKRGYQVVGIDLSESFLRKAKEKANKENVQVAFIRADAQRLSLRSKFGLVLMICGGAFPLMETDELNYGILENASRALQPNGTLILTTLNALFPLYQSLKDFLILPGHNARENTFDLLTFRNISTAEVTDDSGREKKIVCNERFYAPSEIIWYLKRLDFKKVDIFGCKLGKFSRNDKLTPDSYEMLVIAKK